MSAIYTESFIAFGRYTGDDSFDASPGGANQARVNTSLNLQRAGYGVVTSTNVDADHSGGFTVRQDPMYAGRNVLAHSSAASAAVNVGVTAAFKKRIPATDKQIIVGFSIFIPNDYVANVNPSTVPVLRVQATSNSDVAWQTAVLTPIYAAKEAFRIANDLSIRWGTDAAQSPRRLKAGVQNYIEMRISPNELSVWIDDTFVMQKIVSLTAEALAFIFENNINAGAGGTNMSGSSGRWSFGNMYIIFNDGVSPSVRLGPSTRVIGTRPDTDVDVRFIRPETAPTNASVAGQDLVDNPPQQLQSITVGDFDTYSGSQAAADIRTMGMVHTMVTKVLAANLEPDVHNIRPYLKYNGSDEGADLKVRELGLFNVAGMTRTIRGLAIRPTDKCIWAVGDAESAWHSGPNCDITTWTKIQDLGTVNNYIGIQFDDAGNARLSRSDGKRDWLVAGSDTIGVGVANNTSHISSTQISPDGSRWINWIAGTSNAISYTTNPFVASPTFVVVTLAASNVGPATGGYNNSLRVGASEIGIPTNPTGVVTVLTGSGGAAANYRPSDMSDASTFNVAVHDGVYWLVAGISSDTALNGAPRIRRSADLSSWQLATAIGSTVAGAAGTLRAGAANTITHEAMFVGDNGAIVMSMDGANWRQMPRLTTAALYGTVCFPNGDFFMAGAGGAMLTYRAAGTGADTVLQPLAGFSMAFGSSVFNPATGAPWTPDEAADAQFGVRLTT